MAVNGYAAAQDVADLKASTAALAVAMGNRVNTNEENIAAAEAVAAAVPGQLEALENSIEPIAIAAANNKVDKAANGSDFANPNTTRQNLGAQKQGFGRYYDAPVSLSLSGRQTISTGVGLVSDDAIIGAQAGFTANALFSLQEEGKLSGAVVYGTNLPTPTVSWGSGEARGSLLYCGGTALDYFTGAHLSGTFKDFPNGVANFEYVDYIRIPMFESRNTQVSGDVVADGFQLLSNLEIYNSSHLSIGTFISTEYRRKALALNYVSGGNIGSVYTSGGSVGQGNVHGVGTDRIMFGGINHNGPGYGPKFVDCRQILTGPILSKGAQEAIQLYGSHADIEYINSLNHVGAALAVDALGVQVQAPSAEVDVVVRGGIRSDRGASSDNAASGITVRADNVGTTQIKRVEVLGHSYVRGGAHGIWMSSQQGSAEKFRWDNVDIDSLAAGGYLYYGFFRNVTLKNFLVGPSVRNGIIAYTHSPTRDGTFSLSGLRLPQANSSFSSDALISLGYAPGQSFSEAGFKTIVIEDVFVDGAGATDLKLINLACQEIDGVKNIILRNITGINLTQTTQINIVLHASATNVRVFIENVSLTDASGNPLNIAITGAARVIGGSIDRVNARFTTGSRPAKCNPEYFNPTWTGSLADGAITTFLLAVPGVALGDRVDIRPRTTAKIGVSTKYDVWDASNIAVNIANNSGGTITSLPFDVFIERRTIT